ncbi:hypothetical protein [Amycolatopsis sp. EV170708-02-1]|uniref:hypothetical protein n=1 Tax=Amycolatopsis sp. EV170708-02-1 TaxID=2919322 RepID=UPI001F0BC0C9|nr:hypothetical protein [Amycolatopsis sp. EV170708-02-1]UMP07223.1 hypothetical protein MJQ72_21500 [Amycolatopsis sp. EV170708-02-1]
MKNRTRVGIIGAAFAAALFAPASASADTMVSAEAQASCSSGNEGHWYIPDGGGSGSKAGSLYWHDYNESTGNDQDNFLIVDRPFDGQSSSVKVTNNYTGKSYYKHVYSGESFCMGVGNIPNGKTASWKACGWDDGQVVECRTGTITE